MPRYLFHCTVCDSTSSMIVDRGVIPECPVCKQEYTKLFQPPIVIFIPERDMATNHAQGGKYQEWLKSPEVQEKLRKGELRPERSSPVDPITDCLDNV